VCEPIELSFGVISEVGPDIYVLDGARPPEIPFGNSRKSAALKIPGGILGISTNCHFSECSYKNSAISRYIISQNYQNWLCFGLGMGIKINMLFQDLHVVDHL